MKVQSQYAGHAAILASYYGANFDNDTDGALQQDFEAIYENAMDVDYGEAKSYLAGLSPEDMATIRDYHHLADNVDISTLSEEGAYNLLVHKYEQIDFNNDGLIQNGAANIVPVFPQDMSNDLKQSIVDTFTQLKDDGMSERDLFTLRAVVTFRLNINEMNARLNEALGRDAADTTPKTGYSDLVAAQESMHNPPLGGYTDPHIIDLFDSFMEMLESKMDPGSSTSQSSATAVQQSQESQESENEDQQIASFFDKVRAAGGALSYIQQLNMEKIEKLIEEKRKELEEKMGLNAEPPLSPEKLEAAVAAIEDMLDAYKEDLLESMEKRSKSKGFDEDAYLRQLIQNRPVPNNNETQTV